MNAVIFDYRYTIKTLENNKPSAGFVRKKGEEDAIFD
jgi:hypothetical protein